MASEYSGSDDPDRILPLLWRRSHPIDERGSERRTAAGRKPKFTLDAVVDAAIQLADTEGLAAMSMSRLAAALGAGTMTIYSYVASKTDLIDLMVDQVVVERALPAPGEPRAESWRDQVILFAERTLAMYRRHPWLRHVSTIRPPIGPGMLAEQEYLLSTLADTGLAPSQIVRAAGALAAYIEATARDRVDQEELERASGQTEESWWGARMQLWETYFDVERHPTMNAIWNSGGFDDPDDADCHQAENDYGLHRLLDGIEVTMPTAGSGAAE